MQTVTIYVVKGTLVSHQGTGRIVGVGLSGSLVCCLRDIRVPVCRAALVNAV